MVDAPKVNSLLPMPVAVDNELLQFRQAFRAAVESKAVHGLKLAAIVAHMRTRIDGMTEQYLYKLYDGTRPLTDKYIVALPDSVNALFYKILAEQHNGQIVITPTTGPEGVRQFASGLYGFIQQLGSVPVRANAMAKAGLRVRKPKPRTAAGGQR